MFKFYDIPPSTDGTGLQFNMSTDGGSNYNVTKTSTAFRSSHDEADTTTVLEYRTGEDLAQSTGFQNLTNFIGNGNDESLSGSMKLFNTNSSTFVKHFISTVNIYQLNSNSQQWNIAGYGNTTNPVNAIQFKMSSGNIDSGVIKLYALVKYNNNSISAITTAGQLASGSMV